MGQREDILWKGVLEEVFDDFLRFFYPEADNVFDLSRGVTFLDKELDQLHSLDGNNRSTKIVDKLAKVYTHDGKEKWVLIHLEIQGTFRKDFAFRMFTYYYRILDRYQQRIAACAILTEPVLKPRTGIYEQEFMGTSIRYQFKIYKIAEQDVATLRASDNLFALVVLIAISKFMGRNIKDPEVRDKALLAFKRELLMVLDSRSIPKKKIVVLLHFLRHYVQFENFNNHINFTNEMENYKTMKTRDYLFEIELKDTKKRARFEKRQAREEGKAEGKAEGYEQAKIKFIGQLLTLTDYNEEKIAELADVQINFVEQVRADLQKEAKQAHRIQKNTSH